MSSSRGKDRSSREKDQEQQQSWAAGNQNSMCSKILSENSYQWGNQSCSLGAAAGRWCPPWQARLWPGGTHFLLSLLLLLLLSLLLLVVVIITIISILIITNNCNNSYYNDIVSHSANIKYIYLFISSSYLYLL